MIPVQAGARDRLIAWLSLQDSRAERSATARLWRWGLWAALWLRYGHESRSKR